MNKKGLEDSIFTWVVALFVIFFIILIMDVFAFGLIVAYGPDPSTSFESRSVGMLENQYFLNTLSVTERSDYNLLDRVRDSSEDLFEVKNKKGNSVPEIFGLDNAAIPARWSVRHSTGRFAHDSLSPFEIYDFDVDTIERVNQVVDRFNEVKAIPVRSLLNKHCRSSENNAYFFQTPLGVLTPDSLIPSTLAANKFNLQEDNLEESRYIQSVSHISTHLGSDYTIKFRILKECFNQINTGVEDE